MRKIPQDERSLLLTVRGIMRWLKKVDVPVKDLQIGDIICDKIREPFFVTRLEDVGEGIGVYGILESDGGVYCRDYIVRILPREFIKDELEEK